MIFKEVILLIKKRLFDIFLNLARIEFFMFKEFHNHLVIVELIIPDIAIWRFILE